MAGPRSPPTLQWWVHLKTTVLPNGTCRCQVRFQGDGPLNGVLAIANGRLEAKGFVGNPRVTLPPNAKGKLDGTLLLLLLLRPAAETCMARRRARKE